MGTLEVFHIVGDDELATRCHRYVAVWKKFLHKNILLLNAMLPLKFLTK